MLSTVYSAGLYGIDGYLVTVECSTTNAIPDFTLVGLPDSAVKEAEQRIRAALQNSGVKFPNKQLVVNLAPADRKKEGSAFDLALLVAVLTCGERLPNVERLENMCFLGELSLSGAVRPIRGVLPMVLAAKAAGKTEIFVPAENAGEASVVEGVHVYAAANAKDVITVLRGFTMPEAVKPPERSMAYDRLCADFSEIKGQQRAKRAMEIAAAGGHNILLIGPPGTGKSMLAKRLPSILPEMTFDEAIETTKIHSVSGTLPDGVSLITQRPFRSPHHTMSAPSLVGGGKIPQPGEVSLAHNGVLFLDELPEFSKQVTESLRQPLEDGAVTITRTAGRLRFPCHFMLVCAMNPCRCGYYGHPTHPCTCRPEDIKKYLSKISGPMLDRIDIQIEMPSLSFEEMSDTKPAESSAVIRERVNRARAFAAERFKEAVDLESGRQITCNAQLSAAEIRRFCRPDEGALRLLETAFSKMGISARAYDRILRVARTIADLDTSETIEAKHVAEAIQLRSLDRKYF